MCHVDKISYKFTVQPEFWEAGASANPNTAKLPLLGPSARPLTVTCIKTLLYSGTEVVERTSQQSKQSLDIFKQRVKTFSIDPSKSSRSSKSQSTLLASPALSPLNLAPWIHPSIQSIHKILKRLHMRL
ncbi:hypothetical protein C0J50_8531 [Silurus asotus]|uniref:Uncharacterized protein n=1 Tax=Silurus asotus TaxID=30991 RepID=A0AAD5AH36_SILAS|nr:hypothetical protein C0J50_8531 [Silurus asotus]